MLRLNISHCLKIEETILRHGVHAKPATIFLGLLISTSDKILISTSDKICGRCSKIKDMWLE